MLSMQVYHPDAWKGRCCTMGTDPMQTEGWPYILWLSWDKKVGWWRLLDKATRPHGPVWFRAEVTDD